MSAPAWPGAAEPYAPAEPASSCDPSEKPGPVAFRRWVLARFGGTDLGIVRACDGAPTSLHHEGRAWDWGALASRPEDRQRVDRALAFLLAPGPSGPHEAARRAGVRFMIWDGHIWSPAAPNWEPHPGHPHREHVHFGFSRAGASASTSFYRWLELGEPTAPGGPSPVASDGGGAAAGVLLVLAIAAARARGR